MTENMTEDDPPPPAPEGLRTGGVELWSQVVDEYELAPHELRLLRELCRAVDTVDVLQESIDRDGVMVPTVGGDSLKVNPAAVEARQGRIVVARLAAALRLPVDDDEGQGDGRGQRRGAPRGVYTAQAERS
jgi:hypothetical protein